MKSEPQPAGPTTLLSRQATFSAGRILGHSHWTQAQNQGAFGRDCLPHGHNYVLEVAYLGQPDPVTGMIVNLTELKPALAEAINELNGAFLTAELAALCGKNPTAEILGLYLWAKLPGCVGGGTLARVTLQESGKVSVIKTPLSMIVFRNYEFAAAHRLFSPQLSGQENWQTFDKCSNPAGHGHNYQLRVGVSGTPDVETGYIIPPATLDAIVQQEIFERFDHKHLNVDCPEFAHTVPTSENLAQVIFEILQQRLHSEGWSLARVGLHETQKNYFEVQA